MSLTQISLCTSFLLALLPGPITADTFRCNSRLVTDGDHQTEVLQKCGEPASRDFLGYKESIDEYGFWHDLAIEEWTYGPRHGMYHFIRFEGGRLEKVTSHRER